MINLPEQFINYSSLIIIFALFQVSLILLLIYLFVTKVLTAHHENIDEGLVKQEAYDRALKILEDAKEEALKVLTTAEEKARKVMDGVSVATESIQQNLQVEIEKLSQKQTQSLEEISGKMVEAYREAIDEEKDKGVTEIQNATESIKNKINQEMDVFEKALEKNTIDSEKEVQDKVLEEYEKTKKELGEYKKQKMEEIDMKIRSALPELTKEILGKTLTIDDHEGAVFAALEEAKKEKMFEY